MHTNTGRSGKDGLGRAKQGRRSDMQQQCAEWRRDALYGRGLYNEGAKEGGGA